MKSTSENGRPAATETDCRAENPPENSSPSVMRPVAAAQKSRSQMGASSPDDGGDAAPAGSAEPLPADSPFPASAAISTPVNGLPRRGRDLLFHHHGLSQTEARRLAERLEQIEAERTHWRQQMRRQLRLEREEARQRRAVLWAQDRAQRRREREQLRELRQEARRKGAGEDTGEDEDSRR